MPNEFDARNNPSNSFNSRAEMSSEDTLQDIRIKNENERQKILINNLNQWAALSQTLEKQIQKLRVEDAENLNWNRQQLEKKYADIQKKYNLSNYQTQSMLLKELKEKAKEYNVDNAKDELKSFSTNIRFMKKNQKSYMDERKRMLSDLSKVNQEQEKLSQNKISNLQDRIDKSKSASYKKKLQKRLDDEKNNLKKIQADKEKIDEENNKDFFEVLKEQREARKKAQQDIMTATLEGGGTKQDAYKARLEANPYDAVAQIMTHLNDELNNFVNGIKEQFQGIIDDYSSYQSKVNARLQGSGQTWNLGGVGDTLMDAVGSNPYVKLADLMENASKAVEAGIAYNIEQRAFLETVKDDIAATFDAFNSNLLRIVRLQQSDSTAARMGLEADLTQLFNSYFKDTSYLNDAFDTVSANLTEAIAQMGTEEGVAFEYQVQKWLGSLYSVGFSDSAIGNIATALGQLGSGDVSGLASNSQMQNLLVMAASRVGLSYADMLTNGITAQETNTLLQSMVEYLQEIATSDNKVVKSQYSQIFGLTSADLVAAKNLGTTALDIANESLSYAGAVNELYNQMSQLPSRLSMGEMTGNMIDNVKYAIGSGIADNPVTYALWELTDMVEGLSGGLQLPTISIVGNSFDLNTSLTNLARLGIVGAGALGNVGTIISGVGSTFSPSSMLTKLGIQRQAETQTRGAGLNRSQRITNQVSSSNMVGNSSGEDYEASLTAQANAEGDAAIEAKKEEEQTKSINDIHEYLLQVFDPKVTAITRMLASVSGTQLTDVKGWNIFEDANSKQYSATTVSIIGKAGANNNTPELISSIQKDVASRLALLQNDTLKVNVTNKVELANFGLFGIGTNTGGDTGGAGV